MMVFMLTTAIPDNAVRSAISATDALLLITDVIKTIPLYHFKHAFTRWQVGPWEKANGYYGHGARQ